MATIGSILMRFRRVRFGRVHVKSHLRASISTMQQWHTAARRLHRVNNRNQLDLANTWIQTILSFLMSLADQKFAICYPR